MGWRLSSLSQTPRSSTRTSGVLTATPRSPSAASRMSLRSITLLLGFRRRFFRRRLGRRLRRGLVLVVLVTRFFFVFLHDARHIHHEVTRRQVHDLDAL